METIYLSLSAQVAAVTLKSPVHYFQMPRFKHSISLFVNFQFFYFYFYLYFYFVFLYFCIFAFCIFAFCIFPFLICNLFYNKITEAKTYFCCAEV